MQEAVIREWLIPKVLLLCECMPNEFSSVNNGIASTTLRFGMLRERLLHSLAMTNTLELSHS